MGSINVLRDTNGIVIVLTKRFATLGKTKIVLTLWFSINMDDHII